MRILHTSDWHLGKTLEGRSRQEEQVRFVDELCGICDDQQIDLVLIAGDIYDGVNPPAFAEDLFYDALDRLAKGGKRAVVIISGNHDNPERLCAAEPLAARYGITLCGLPNERLKVSGLSGSGLVRRVEADTGWMKLHIPGCEETANLVLLPYPSEARLNEVLSRSLEDHILQQAYGERIRNLFAALNGRYDERSVNLGISHLYVRGGLESDSERDIKVGGAYIVDPEHLPGGAHYVALGHLHRPQNVGGSLVPARYSGSPLAYSFSETGYTKSVTVIEAFPGKAANIREIYLTSGYPLVKWQAKAGLPQVLGWLEEKKDPTAWIDLEIHLTQALTTQEVQNLRRLRERIVNIRPIFPEMEQVVLEARTKLPVGTLFHHFYESRMGVAPAPELVELFLHLIRPEAEVAAEKEDEE